MKPVDFNFKTLVRDDKPNSYLVCPKDYCHTKIDAISPVFQVNIVTLENAWQKMMVLQPRVEKISEDKSTHTYQYVQRSFLFRFPDYINVQFIALDNTQSTLAIYSHAVYGYYDFHVNEKRVKSWLAQLNLIEKI